MSAGVKGNLTESKSYIMGNFAVTVPAILVSVYFLVWQTYVMRMDIIISSILVAIYFLDEVMALVTVARLARLVPLPLVFIAARTKVTIPILFYWKYCIFCWVTIITVH